MSDSIITIDVGGQIFKTHISTLTKFPDSLLATMFNHREEGMAPMAKTKEGDYFLDADPLHFREILHYLRYGKIVAQDSSLLEGVKDLANYLGLTELVNQHGSREEDDGWVTLDLDGRKEIKMSLRTLTGQNTNSYKSSTLAKYFLGDEEARNKLARWIKKENETRYFIGRPLEMCDDLFEFLRTDGWDITNTKFPISNAKGNVKLRCRFEAELKLFGLENYYNVVCNYNQYTLL